MPISAFGVLALNAKSRKSVAPEALADEGLDSCGHSIAYDQTTTAVSNLKKLENLERNSTPTAEGRGSSVFPLTRAVTGRINKQELLDANT